MNNYNYDDPAHEADLKQLKKDQLDADISPEEANEECQWDPLDDDSLYYDAH